MIRSKERRGGGRVACLLGAVATQVSPLRNFRCIVKDMSVTGCRVVGVDIDTIQSPFLLRVDNWPAERACEVAWRAKKMIGVRFGEWVKAPSPAP